MKKVLSLLIVGLFLIGSMMGVLGMQSQPVSDAISSSEINLTRTYQAPVVSHSVFDQIEIDGLENYYEEGKPIIPFEPVTVLIPQGEQVEEILVLEGVETMLEGIYHFDITQESRPTGEKEEAKYITNWEGREPYFPPETFLDTGTQIYRGYSLLTINLFPVKCHIDGTISYYEKIDITIITGTADGHENGNTFRGLARDRQELLNIADDVSALSGYAAEPQVNDGLTAGLYDYVIITNEVLVPEFEPLVDWKNARGINTIIKTVEDIDTENQGNDLQDKIRNFIKEAYTEWNIDYVLLGGDIDVVPYRGLYGNCGIGYEDFDIPADIYYAALDGTWDDDGDGIWGEVGEEDAFAEVYVGRAPVSEANEAARFVEKVIAYETTPNDSPVVRETIFVGQALDEIITWGGDYKDEIERFIPANYNLTKFYEKDGTFDKLKMIDQINNGTHIINNMGHGNIGRLSDLFISDIDLMTNEDYFIWYSQSCYVASFDNKNTYGGEAHYDSIAENMVMSQTGGAVAFVGNSRYGWYTPGYTSGTSQQYDKEFFNQLFNLEQNKLGKTLQLSKEKYAPMISRLGSYRWVYFTLNLLGDPTLKVAGNFIDSPYGLEANAGNGYIDLSWEAPEQSAGLSNYNIFKGTASGSETFYTTIGDVSNYRDNDVINGITYYYYVTALSQEGESSSSNEASTTPGLPSEPRNFQALPGSSMAILSWDPPFIDGGHPITNYIVYRGTDEVGFTPIITLGDVASYNDDTIINGVRYYYCVAASNSLIEGPLSNCDDVITGIPTEPLNVQASPGDNHVLITWNPPVDDGNMVITNYIIYRGIESGKVVYFDTTGSELEYRDYDVSPETTYYYRISAQNRAFEGPLSNEASAMSYTVRWPMFRRDISNTGFASTDATSNDLKLKWSYLTGNAISSSPSIGKDGTIYFGSDDGNLYAMNPGGKLEWSYSTGGAISYSSPAIADDGTVYICSSDRNIHAVNPDGTLKWNYRAARPIKTSPVFGDDGSIYFGSDNNRFYALNSDGTEKWFFRAKGSVQSSAALGAQGTIFFGSNDDRIYSLNSDGSLKWEYETGGDVRSSPAIGRDGTVYVGSNDGGLYALKPDGNLKWKYMTGNSIDSSPSIDNDGNIHITSSSGYLYALKPDGAVLRRYQTSDSVSFSSPTVDSSGNVILGANNKVLALSSEGILKHSYTTDGPVESSAALDIDGTIYIGSSDGKLYSFVNNSYNGPVQNMNTGESFDFIQAAIDDSDTLNGHTITVESGTYNENVVINKEITIQGDNRDNTIVRGIGTGHVFHVAANNVQITGLTISNGGSGTQDSGIMVENSENVWINDNMISGNKRNGIMLSSASTKDCHIEENIITDNYNGIYLLGTDANTIQYNDIQVNNYGILVWEADQNTIQSNSISFNTGMGLSFQTAWNNNIYHNTIFDNEIQASESEGVNNWDAGYPDGGNTWSDYVGSDIYSGPNQDIAGPDGIGDVAYTEIAGSGLAMDNYPLYDNGTTIAYLAINPATAEITANEDLKFTALAYDEYNNIIPDITFTWSTNIGTINQAGFFTAPPVPGTGYAQAAFGELYVRASITILSNNSWSIDLVSGWNLVSIPLIPENMGASGVLEAPDLSEVLSSITGKWDYLKYYDAQDVSDPWKSNSPLRPPSINDIIEIGNKMGFWLHTTEACTLTVTGSRPITTNINLYSGWNLVGFPSENPMSIENALTGTGYDVIEGFDMGSSYLLTTLTGTDMMVPGNGYWVHVPATTVWSVDW